MRVIKEETLIQVEIGKTYKILVQRLSIHVHHGHIPSAYESFKKLVIVKQIDDTSWTVHLDKKPFRLDLNYERDSYYLLSQHSKYLVLNLTEI